MVSWKRLFWLGDIGQQLDIGDIEDDVSQLRSTAKRMAGTDREQNAAIAALEREVDDLRIVVAELARLLAAQGTLTAEQLASIAKAVDGPGSGASR
jgi:hypothetical protein